MRLRTTALVTVLVVGATLTTPSVAIAKVHYEYDPAGDVRYTTVDVEEPNPENYESGPAASRNHGDIIRTRISHGASKVRVSVQYRALTHGGLEHRHSLYIGSDQGRFTLNKAPEPGNWAGGYGVVLGYGDTPSVPSRVTDEGPVPYRCPGLYVRVDYVNDRFLAEVPRSCLGNPKWIKVGFTTQILVDHPVGFRIYEDRSFSNGAATPSALSPKILPSFTIAAS